MNEGYILVAFGEQKYIDIAIHAATSLRYFDKKRKIQLITDRRQSEIHSFKFLFDHIDQIEIDSNYPGALQKILVYEFARYDYNIFIDADCLLLKDDIDLWWDYCKHEQLPVGFIGNYVNKGIWYGTSIETMCRLASTNKILQMNSGAFYFKKCDVAQRFFFLVKSLANELEILRFMHQGGITDEPFFGLAYSIMELNPIPFLTSERYGLMISTVNSKDFVFDWENRKFHFIKNATGDNIFVYPTIIHFVDLNPKTEYCALCSKIISEYGVDQTQFLKKLLH